MRLLWIVVIVAAAVAALLAYGGRRWDAGTRQLRARLDAARSAVPPARVDFSELEGLPPPVARYFRLVLREGQPVVATVRVRHLGTILMDGPKAAWKPFTSDQYVVASRPGFVWDGRVVMAPGLKARVHDAYADGEGILHASLFGLVTVADLRDRGEMARGELMRFLAESAWYPTVLLPSQGVRWHAIDDRSARATLGDGAVEVSLTFAFDATGLIASVRSDARGRTVDGQLVPTPWLGRFSRYEARAGMRVPLEAEVCWVVENEPAPYWRGHIVDIVHTFTDAGRN